MSAPDPTLAELTLSRGFVAMQYLLGRRNDELVAPLGLSEPARVSCDTLLRHLRTPDKSTRARALAAEIAILVRSLQQRELA